VLSDNNESKIAVVGLGYVGLPLAVEFGKKYKTIGFDIDEDRLIELRDGNDSTFEVTKEELEASTKLFFSSKLADLRTCNIYIVTVPTPVDIHNQPDLSLLVKASETIASVLSEGDIVIYESTVYPGATEEVCVPVLEKTSNLSFNVDFFVGYSPERINPGDKKHRLTSILKITSGSTPDIAEKIDKLYQSIVTAGTYKVSSIKVAEAAKVIENTQRDVNIALINELSLIFNRLGIDTEEVLNAAGTKWNFLPFRPGLVGGHCIGVDPYYLTYKAESVGYNPEIILAGRRLNDGMGAYVSSQLVKALMAKGINIANSRVLVMGLAFKENCPDLRNSKVLDIIFELESFSMEVDCYDPWVDPIECKNEYDIRLLEEPDVGKYDAVLIAVAHQQFIDMGEEKIRALGKSDHIIYDLKYILDSEASDLRL